MANVRFDTFRLCNFLEPDSIKVHGELSKDAAAAFLGVKKVKVSVAIDRSCHGESKRVKKVEHKDGTFQFLLRPQVEPASGVKAKTVKDLIHASGKCVHALLSSSSSSKAPEARKMVSDISTHHLFNKNANEDGMALLNAILQGRVQLLLEKMMSRTY